MPTAIIQILEVKQVKNNIIFTARQGDNIISREVDVSEFDTWLKFAQWIINQPPDYVRLPTRERTLTITFHIEIIDDQQVRVVDSVVAT